MGKDWPYAKMSHEASEAGGPEKWVEMIKHDAYENGAEDMQEKMMLWVYVAAGVGALTTFLAQKVKNHIEKKKEEKQKRADSAKEATEKIIEYMAEEKEDDRTGEG